MSKETKKNLSYLNNRRSSTSRPRSSRRSRLKENKSKNQKERKRAVYHLGLSLLILGHTLKRANFEFLDQQLVKPDLRRLQLGVRARAGVEALGGPATRLGGGRFS